MGGCVVLSVTTYGLVMREHRPWEQAAGEIRTALVDGLDVAGVVDQAEILSSEGATTELDLVIELTDLEGPEQADAYTVLCGLLATIHAERGKPAIGILLVAGEIDVGSLAQGLTQMARQDREETLVLPLTSDQASAVAGSGAHLFDMVDQAVPLIQVAADPHLGTTLLHAEHLLGELDVLIERHCG